VVVSNQSSEVGILHFDGSSSSLSIMEPDEPLKLPIDEGTTDRENFSNRILFTASQLSASLLHCLNYRFK
jgi:hypothetical protein